MSQIFHNELTGMEKYYTRQLNSIILELETMLLEFEDFLKRDNHLPIVYKNALGEITQEAKAEIRVFDRQYIDIHEMKKAINNFKDTVKSYKELYEK